MLCGLAIINIFSLSSVSCLLEDTCRLQTNHSPKQLFNPVSDSCSKSEHSSPEMTHYSAIVDTDKAEIIAKGKEETDLSNETSPLPKQGEGDARDDPGRVHQRGVPGGVLKGTIH